MLNFRQLRKSNKMPINIDFVNQIVFEVVKITFLPGGSVTSSGVNESFSTTDKSTSVQTVALHPLLVGPTTIHYSDTSKTAITQNIRGIHTNKAGRQPIAVSLEGTFGQKPKFVGLGFLNGIQRLKLFWDEVVRLPDMVTLRDFERTRHLFSITPSLLFSGFRQSFQEEVEIFAINFYDFNEGRAFSCNIDKFDLQKQYTTRNNLPTYHLTIKETGPVITNNLLFGASIEDLLKADAIFDAVVNTLISNAPQVWIDGLEDLVIGVKKTVSQISSIIDSFISPNIDFLRSALTGNPVIDLANRTNTPPLAGIQSSKSDQNQQTLTEKAKNTSNFKKNMTTLIVLQEEMIAKFTPIGTKAIPAISKTVVSLDLNVSNETDPEFLLYKMGISQAAAEDMFNFHRIFQLNTDEFDQRLATISSGESLPPQIPATKRHKVLLNETIFDIAKLYNTDWQTILTYSNLDPDDVIDGLILEIPFTEALSPIPFPDIPTFGSHRGVSVLGLDLSNSLTFSPDGDLFVLSFGGSFLQGINNIVALLEQDFFDAKEEILKEATYKATLQIKAEAAFAEDKRIREIREINIVTEEQAISIDTTLKSVADVEIDQTIITAATT